MGASASIAQEYYKVQGYWREIDLDEKWRLAIWVADYYDLEIIDKFFEVERSVLGRFDDIFYRFDTEFRGDIKQFEKELFEEWVSWFHEELDPKYDILKALKNDEMLIFDYMPDTGLEPTAANLWKEMLRFKSSIETLEEDHFCVYIPPTSPEGPKLTDWFSMILDEGVPQGIRLTTVDFAEKRKVKLQASSKVHIIKPKLNMAAAISNDMDKGIISKNATSVENQYTLQIKKVMDCTLEKSTPVLDKEIKKLFSLSDQMKSVSTSISSLMIAAQAYYSIENKKKCEEYSDRAIKESEEAMNAGEPTGYPIWRSVIMLKAATLASDKKRREAIELYEKLAKEAAKRVDAFYVMEAYRMAGHFYYELGELNTALETTLLSLYGGSYLEKDVRRQSTFLFSAALALHLAKQIRGEKDMEIIESSLEEWLGSDWRELVETEDMEKVKDRRKSSFLS